MMVAFHKEVSVPRIDCYLPVEVGAALHTEHFDGAQRDDDGENISAENKAFCELTAVYWAWKNLDADCIGLCHYRRFFTQNILLKQPVSEKDIAGLLENHSAVLPKPRHYFIETNYSQYAHAHHEKDLLELRSVLCELYPEYLPFFEKCMARTYGHRFNMFIMRREVFNSYCQWLFDVLFKTQKRLNTAGYDSYNMRVFGFLGERLIDCWLEKNQIDYVEMPVYFTEKQYWIKKITSFLYRKYSHELQNGRGRF